MQAGDDDDHNDDVHPPPPPPVAMARGRVTAKTVAQDLLSRPKNTNNKKPTESVSLESSSSSSTAAAGTVFVTTTSTKNGNRNTSAEENHHFLDCSAAAASTGELVNVLRNRNKIANQGDNHNYGNECTIGQQSSLLRVVAVNDQSSGSHGERQQQHKTTTTAGDAILRDTALTHNNSRNYYYRGDDYVQMSRNLPVNRTTTTAIEVNQSASIEAATNRPSCTGDVIVVVGGTTTSATDNNDDPLQNRNRIEIKATELRGGGGRFEGNNWQQQQQQQNQNNLSSLTRTKLLIRSGSSASSDSSLSTTSSGSLSSSKYGGAGEASSKSMAQQQQQQRTEIIINHSPCNLSNSNGRVQYPVRGSAATTTPSTITTSLAGVVRPEPEGGESEPPICSANEHRTDAKTKKATPAPVAALKTAVQLDRLPRERKVAFHEKLISELAAMHQPMPSPPPEVMQSRQDEERDRATTVEEELHQQLQMKRLSIESQDRASTSPNGSHRSRIRTADWIEVGDNGKKMVFSSCQISLEDSGLEDEMERLEETSSSGAGDSWDSVIDHDER